jgi:hypothetical protein
VGTSRIDAFARRLKSLDTSTVYPFALYLLGLPSTDLPKSELHQIFEDCESYLVRRFVCQLTNKNYNRLFVSLLAHVRQARDRNEDISTSVRTYLLSLKGPAVYWPTDTEFERGWLERPIYVHSRSDRAAMVLRALEERIRTTRNEPLVVPAGLTVEHLLPQTADPAVYPFTAEPQLGPEETLEQRRAKLIRTIGNLTLLTRPLNSSISNGPFVKKSEEIGKDSDLRLNAQFRGAPQASWSEKNILANGKAWFTYAAKIWPYPSDGQTPVARPAAAAASSSAP